MLRKVLFNIHWFLGITVGIALAIMGATGAIMSFEPEILAWLNNHPARVTQGSTLLTTEQLVARIQAAYPQQSLSALTFHSDPAQAVKVEFAAGGNRPRPGEVATETLINPYTGDIFTITPARGVAFMGAVERLHRRLTLWSDQGGPAPQGGPGGSDGQGDGRAPGQAPPAQMPPQDVSLQGAVPEGMRAGQGMSARPFSLGEQATSYAVLVLMIMALSGLYLRWPRRQAGKLSSWLKINLRLKGYAFHYNLHAVIGTVVLAGYLVSAHSGLMMSEIDWYKRGVNTLAGVSEQRGPRGFGGGTANDTHYALDTLWAEFNKIVPEYSAATIQFGQSSAAELRISYLTHPAVGKEGGRDTSLVVLDAVTGAVERHEQFADKPWLQRLTTRNFDLHSGAYFGVPGRIFIALTSLLMPVLLVTGWLQYLARRRQKQQRAAALASAQGRR